MVKALLVKPGETGEVIDVEPQLAPLQALVGGRLEGITPSEHPVSGFGGWHAYCNEEGKMHGLRVNDFATTLAMALGWPVRGDVLCGAVVFLGNGPEGEEADVPRGVLFGQESLIKFRRGLS